MEHNLSFYFSIRQKINQQTLPVFHLKHRIILKQFKIEKYHMDVIQSNMIVNLLLLCFIFVIIDRTFNDTCRRFSSKNRRCSWWKRLSRNSKDKFLFFRYILYLFKFFSASWIKKYSLVWIYISRSWSISCAYYRWFNDCTSCQCSFFEWSRLCIWYSYYCSFKYVSYLRLEIQKQKSVLLNFFVFNF